jgi:uridine kinase
MATPLPPPAPLPRAERLAALGRCEILAGLSDAERAALLDQMTAAEVPAGAAVSREGEPGADLFFVLAGQIRLWRNDRPLRTLGPGGHFGALSLITGRPRSVSASAASPASLAVLRRPGWDRLALEHPSLALRVLQAVVGHLRDELLERTDSLSLLLGGRSLPRAHEVRVEVGGQTLQVATGTPLRALLPSHVDGALVVAGLLGQKPVSLATPLCADSVVAPLTSAHWEGRHVYTRSAGLMLLEAAYALDPELRVRMGPSLGTTQLVELPADADPAALAAPLAAELSRLANQDLAFRHELWATDEALAWFEGRGWGEAARLLRWRRQGTVPLVSCGQVYALGMGPFLPSTALVRDLQLSVQGQDLLVDYGKNDPRNHRGSPAAPAPERDGDMVRDHRAWLGAMGVDSVGAFNGLCVSGQVSQLIRVSEGFHEKRIGAIADAVAAARDRLRIIAIAGPSSSGKTTFIKRLTVQLQVAGLNPVGISLDDYYVDRVHNPRDARGEYDFEALEALDLRLLQDHLRRLLAGERLRTARYDFRAGQSHPEGGPSIALHRGDVLLLEGIHGLNPRLLGDIPSRGELFRVFIHPATTLPFDRLSRVSATDVRLLRRIVRDRHTRGYSAAENIARWPSVQEGERRHIFPFRGEADAVFDSALVYEPAVLKVYAERYLLEVPPDHPAYATAWRLRTLIDRFVAIYPDHVPPTSIMREFIGGSGFEY